MSKGQGGAGGSGGGGSTAARGGSRLETPRKATLSRRGGSGWSGIGVARRLGFEALGFGHQIDEVLGDALVVLG